MPLSATCVRVVGLWLEYVSGHSQQYQTSLALGIEKISERGGRWWESRPEQGKRGRSSVTGSRWCGETYLLHCY